MTPPALRREDRLAGGLYGLLVGDALGVPYEFHPPYHLPPREKLEMEPPPEFSLRRTHRRVPPGTWSDDGAQALCLLESLLARGNLDVEDFGRRLVRWRHEGHLAVDGRVFDVGVTTGKALANLKRGVPADAAGLCGAWENGNGSLMRVLPLALWHTGPDEAPVRAAMRQSTVTHGHLRSQVCCALYCLWARRTLEGATDAWAAAVSGLRSLLHAGSAAREELEVHVHPDAETTGAGTGYVVDTLRSARDCVRAEATYEGVVKAAVALGHDTDTTACVAGGIAGLREGVGAIPPRWLEALRGREVADALLRRLLARHVQREGAAPARDAAGQED